jgi:hypothetical protein
MEEFETNEFGYSKSSSMKDELHREREIEKIRMEDRRHKIMAMEIKARKEYEEEVSRGRFKEYHLRLSGDEFLAAPAPAEPVDDTPRPEIFGSF